MLNTIISLLPKTIYLYLRWYDFKFNRKEHFRKSQELRLRETDTWSSYKPFDDRKAIFVHIPKCAGISINRALFGNLAGGHTTFDQYIQIFEPAAINRYFKFTIVRNPWDRVVSAYFFLKQGGFNKWDTEFFEKELSVYNSFEDFVVNWISKPCNLKKHHHFRFQTDYIFDNYHKVPLDFIGRLENLESDFRYIANKLGIDAKLENQNSSTRSRYQSYYNEKTKNIVAEAYRVDIESLKYSFDGFL